MNSTYSEPELLKALCLLFTDTFFVSRGEVWGWNVDQPADLEDPAVIGNNECYDLAELHEQVLAHLDRLEEQREESQREEGMAHHEAVARAHEQMR